MKTSKIESIVLNIYRELYKKSEPKGDYDQLLKDAIINKQGQKVIPFMDYEISQDKYKEIVDKHIPNKIDKFYQQQIRNTIALGCSPKFKEN